jgi:hypothetical protein
VLLVSLQRWIVYVSVETENWRNNLGSTRRPESKEALQIQTLPSLLKKYREVITSNGCRIRRLSWPWELGLANDGDWGLEWAWLSHSHDTWGHTSDTLFNLVDAKADRFIKSKQRKLTRVGMLRNLRTHFSSVENTHNVLGIVTLDSFQFGTILKVFLSWELFFLSHCLVLAKRMGGIYNPLCWIYHKYSKATQLLGNWWGN